MPKLMEMIFGGGDKTRKLSTMSPEQSQFLNSILQLLGGEGELGEGYEEALEQLREIMQPDSASYERFAEPYMRQLKSKPYQE
jgi:hypothetical protein